MASILPSSFSPTLRRQSSKLSLQVQSISTTCSCSSSYSSLSRLSRQSQFSRPHRTRSLGNIYFPFPPSQTRSFATKLVQPFSKSNPVKATSEQKSSSATEAGRLPLTNLPYFIRRTPSNQLPVYLITKAGGTKQLTKVQKTEGDMDALRQDLIHALGMEQTPGDVQINRLNGHIAVKGWRKPEIQQFLIERRF